MSKAALKVIAVLSDYHLARQKLHSDLTVLGVGWDEDRDVPFDGRFAARVAKVDTFGEGHIDTVKLDPQFVVPQRENSEFAFVETVDTVDLRGRDNRCRRRF